MNTRTNNNMYDLYVTAEGREEFRSNVAPITEAELFEAINLYSQRCLFGGTAQFRVVVIGYVNAKGELKTNESFVDYNYNTEVSEDDVPFGDDKEVELIKDIDCDTSIKV